MNGELWKSSRLRRPSEKLLSTADEMQSPNLQAKQRKRKDDLQFKMTKTEQLHCSSNSSNIQDLSDSYKVDITTSSSYEATTLKSTKPLSTTLNPKAQNVQSNYEKSNPRFSSLSISNCDTVTPDTSLISTTNREHQKHSSPSFVILNDEFKPLFKCTLCQDSFCYEENLKLHMTVHTGRKSCMECGKLFSKASDLKRHIRIHSGEKPFQCAICKKAFARRDDVKRHISIHRKKSDIQPETILEAFESISDPDALQAIDTTFKCGVCGKEFDRNFKLQRHILIHMEHKPHICGVCDKSFTECGDLKRHIKTHMDIKPHNCEICGKTFAQSGELKSHMRTHTGERPYKCYVCFKAFVKSSDLNRHMRVHTMERPYVCSYCGKGFKGSSNLKTHMRTHTGDKPFKCSLCPKAFADLSNYNKHIKLHAIELNGPTDSPHLDNTNTPNCDETHSIPLQQPTLFENNDNDYNILSSKLIEVHPDTISSHIQAALKEHDAKEEIIMT